MKIDLGALLVVLENDGQLGDGTVGNVLIVNGEWCQVDRCQMGDELVDKTTVGHLEQCRLERRHNATPYQKQVTKIFLPAAGQHVQLIHVICTSHKIVIRARHSALI